MWVGVHFLMVDMGRCERFMDRCGQLRVGVNFLWVCVEWCGLVRLSVARFGSVWVGA